MASEFLEQAKRMWSHSRVEGSGPFAAVLPCTYRVVLCDLALEAEALASQPCCTHCSSTSHKLVELIIPRPAHGTRSNSLRKMMMAED
jgi:hypothetical protein